jgi:hypothetical protein
MVFPKHLDKNTIKHTNSWQQRFFFKTLSKVIAHKTLEKCYLLKQNEREYIHTYIRGNKLRGTLAVQLKVFQDLGYFVDMEAVPIGIVGFIREQLNIPHNLKLSATISELYLDIGNGLETTYRLNYGTQKS